MFKRFLIISLFALSSSLIFAHEAGDIIVRAGIAHVSPNDDSSTVLAAGDGVEVDSATALGLNFAYMLTDNWGVEVLASSPFEHDINGKGTLAGLGKIGSTKHLPPTVSLQYYFDQSSTMTPYVGLGLNYTLFFEEDTTASLTNALGATTTDLSLSNSFGFSAQAGIDWEINNQWSVNSSLYYIDIETDADVIVNGAKAATVNVDIDPWVFMLGLSRKF